MSAHATASASTPTAPCATCTSSPTVPTRRLRRADVCESAIGVAGQRWLAGCTVVTGAPIASTFVDELCAATVAVRVGPSTDPATSMGPVVQRFRQRELVDRVRDVGEDVDVLVDGSSYAEDVGYFFGPTVVDHVPAGHPLLVEQVPGPIISVVRDGREWLPTSTTATPTAR